MTGLTGRCQVVQHIPKAWREFILLRSHQCCQKVKECSILSKAAQKSGYKVQVSVIYFFFLPKEICFQVTAPHHQHESQDKQHYLEQKKDTILYDSLNLLALDRFLILGSGVDSKVRKAQRTHGILTDFLLNAAI